MSRIHKAFAAQTEQLGPRQVRVICTTGVVDRAGEQVVQSGIDLTGFLANPIILWQHDPEHPIGSASEIQRSATDIQMVIDFAPEGISKKADEICGLVKAGVLKTVSIGFDPTDFELMDPGMKGKKNPPLRYLTCDLMEVSIVSIPANKEAVVTQRAMVRRSAEDWTVAAAKDLEIDEESDWDGRDAAERILDDAGFNGDHPDAAKASKGFLAYDATNPGLKGSYKLPFADIKNGKLIAVASGIRAAASRISQTDIPESTKKEAQAVIDAYEEKMKSAEDEKKNVIARRHKSLGLKQGGVMVVKDLSDIGHLAWLLDSLGWLQSSARIEAALEGDDSKLPAQLAAVMQDLGAALIAMTVEEVQEAIVEAQGTLGQEQEMDGLGADDVVIVQAGKTPAARRFLAGMCRAKAMATVVVKSGKKISANTAEVLRDALAQHDEAMDSHRAALKAHTKSANMIKGLLEDADSKEVQTSSGTGDSDGSANAKAMAARRKAVDGLRTAA
jgi:HK97 family phage prohead protease